MYPTTSQDKILTAGWSSGVAYSSCILHPEEGAVSLAALRGMEQLLKIRKKKHVFIEKY